MEFVSSFDFINDQQIVSVSGDKTLRLWNFKEGLQLDVLELDFVPLLMKVFNESIFICSLDNKLTIFQYHLDADKLKLEKKGEKQYPSDIEMSSCGEQFYVKFIQNGIIYIDCVIVKEKLTIYKNLHENLLQVLKSNDASSFKPFDIKFLFKNAKFEGNDHKNFDYKRVNVDELKAKRKKVKV